MQTEQESQTETVTEASKSVAASNSGKGSDRSDDLDLTETIDLTENADATEPPSAHALAEATAAIEAIIMVSIDPIPASLLAQMVELPSQLVDEICQQLSNDYKALKRGFELSKIAGGWRYQSAAAMAGYVERFALEGQTARLSAAALETLSIVAYKQPISRAQVSAIRGVNVDGVLRTLTQRGYLGEVARDSGPGQAVLFGTTTLFLERLGLDSVSDLPPLGDFVPAASVVEALEDSLRITGESGVADSEE